MKTISKILYNIISFSIFIAYKVENVYAGLVITTFSKKELSSTTECPSNINTADRAPFDIRDALNTYLTTVDLCGVNEYLNNCDDHITSQIDAAALAGYCTDAKSIKCETCPTAPHGTTGSKTTLLKLKEPFEETTVTICSVAQLTEGPDGTIQAGFLEGYDSVWLQTYTIIFKKYDARSWRSLNPRITNCKLLAGTQNIHGKYGSYTVIEQDCEYDESDDAVSIITTEELLNDNNAAGSEVSSGIQSVL